MTVFHVLKYDAEKIILTNIYKGVALDDLLPPDICNKFMNEVDALYTNTQSTTFYIKLLREVLGKYEGPE